MSGPVTATPASSSDGGVTSSIAGVLSRLIGRRTSSRCWAIAIAATALAACSDPKAATEANFRKAIEPLVRDRFCRDLEGVDRLQVGTAHDVPAWPLIIPAKPFADQDRSGEQARAALQGAAMDGMLDRRTETLATKRVRYDEQPTLRPVIVYTPTSKGAAFFRPIELRTPSGMRSFPGLCLARAEIVDIVRWTEPTAIFGATIAQVTYRYRAADVMPLVPETERKALEAPKEATVTLMLASDGWRPAGGA